MACTMSLLNVPMGGLDAGSVPVVAYRLNAFFRLFWPDANANRATRFDSGIG